MSARRKWSPEQKHAAVEQMAQGLSVAKTSEATGIPIATLALWRSRARKAQRHELVKAPPTDISSVFAAFTSLMNQLPPEQRERIIQAYIALYGRS